MKHRYEEHRNCRRQYCAICENGLAYCTVCGTFEGGLTTECCGRAVTEQEVEAVYVGDLDFRGGEWVRGVSVNSPAYYLTEEYV